MAQTVDELRGRDLYVATRDRLPPARVGTVGILAVALAAILAVALAAIMILGPLAAGVLLWPTGPVQP